MIILTPNIALKSGSRNLNGIFDTCNRFGWFFWSLWTRDAIDVGVVVTADVTIPLTAFKLAITWEVVCDATVLEDAAAAAAAAAAVIDGSPPIIDTPLDVGNSVEVVVWWIVLVVVVLLFIPVFMALLLPIPILLALLIAICPLFVPEVFSDVPIVLVPLPVDVLIPAPLLLPVPLPVIPLFPLDGCCCCCCWPIVQEVSDSFCCNKLF